MKRVTIIRHSQLQKPYDNYDNLSYEVINKLAKGKIDPNISNQTDDLVAKSIILRGNYDLIINSNSRRTLESAEHIIKILDFSGVKRIEDNCVNEITFDVKSLVTLEEYALSGLNSIRITLYKGVVENTAGVESYDSVCNRLELFKSLLETRKEGKVLVITHGFFMRFIYYYFELLKIGGIVDYKELAKLVVDSSMRFNYLDGFVVEL